MKKHLFIAALSLFAFATAFAQKGSVLLEGNLSFDDAQYPNLPSGPTTSSLSFSISPLLGYQFCAHWTAGILLGYNYSESKDPHITSVIAYSVGVFGRYTHALSSWVSIYGQLQAVRMDEGEIINNANGNPEDLNVGSIQLFPALFFDVKNGFRLNLSFGGLEGDLYHVHTVGTYEKNISLTFGNSVLLGVSKNFGGHRKAG